MPVITSQEEVWQEWQAMSDAAEGGAVSDADLRCLIHKHFGAAGRQDRRGMHNPYAVMHKPCAGVQ